MKLYEPRLKGQGQFKMRKCLKILKLLGGSKLRRKLSCSPGSFLLELRTESRAQRVEVRATKSHSQGIELGH